MADASKLEGIHQIPELVRGGIHPLAQQTWADGYNAHVKDTAMQGRTATKQEAAQAAWMMVHRVHGGQLASAMPYADQGEGEVSLFMQEVNVADVTVEKRENGTALIGGMPLMRPGTWNGKTYSADDLVGIAETTNRKVAADKVMPYMAPYHTFDRDGKPEKVAAGDNLGWMQPGSLRFDTTDQMLKADIELVNAQAVADLEVGKLKYTSSEVWSGGKIASTGESIGAYMPGAAFVLNPAIKGMDYRLVVNSEDIPEASSSVGGQLADDTSEPLEARIAKPDIASHADAGKGRWIMFEALKAKVLDALGVAQRVAAGDEQPEALKPVVETLQEIVGGESAAPPVIPPQPQTFAEQFPEEAAKLVAFQEREATRIAGEAAAETQRRKDVAAQIVGKWTERRKLPAAAQPKFIALAEALAGREVKATMTMLAEDGVTETAQEFDALTLLDEAMSAFGEIVSATPKGNMFLGAEVESSDPVPLTEEQIKASADRVRGKKV